MTKEKAISILSRPKTMKNAPNDILKAHEMAIKALEQEPCEDAISRQAVIDAIRRIGMCKCSTNEIEAVDECRRAVEALPSVSTEKTGHWIEHEWKEMREKGYYRCSVCNCSYQRYIKGVRKSDVPYIGGKEYTLHNIDNYCPNCGCRMVEPQESEE